MPSVGHAGHLFLRIGWRRLEPRWTLEASAPTSPMSALTGAAEVLILRRHHTRSGGQSRPTSLSCTLSAK